MGQLPNYRMPPQNIDAEESLVGACIGFRECAQESLDIIAPGDLYFEKHQLILNAAQSLARENRSFDFIIIADRLKKENNLERAGGMEYISHLLSESVTTVHFKEHCDLVIDKAKKRKLIAIAAQIMTDGYGETKSGVELHADALAMLTEFEPTNKNEGLKPLREIAIKTRDRIAKEVDGDDKTFLTGLYDYDTKTGGWDPGEWIVIAGVPGTGKTAFVLTACFNNMNKRIAFFSLEMSDDSLVRRLISMKTGIASNWIKGSKLGSNEMHDINAAFQEFEKNNDIYINDDPDINGNKILRQCKKLQANGGLDLVVVDNLQIMSPEESKSSRVEEVEANTRTLKLAAKSLNVPLVTISHLTKGEYDPYVAPELKALRGAGSIASDADQVFFLINAKDIPDKKIFVYRKYRNNNPTIGGDLGWSGKQTLFTDYIPNDPKNFTEGIKKEDSLEKKLKELNSKNNHDPFMDFDDSGSWNA